MFDQMAVADITEQRVRAWRKSRLDTGATPVTVAKAYRLLKAVLNTAVDDGLIRRNPCRIKGPSQEKSPERPVLSMSDIGALADAIDQRYHALVLLAIFGSLRWGESNARKWGGSSKGCWRVAGSRVLQVSLPNSYWNRLGLKTLSQTWQRLNPTA
jgi:integrase